MSLSAASVWPLTVSRLTAHDPKKVGNVQADKIQYLTESMKQLSQDLYLELPSATAQETRPALKAAAAMHKAAAALTELKAATQQ